jgi:hypothetical protein
LVIEGLVGTVGMLVEMPALVIVAGTVIVIATLEDVSDSRTLSLVVSVERLKVFY